MFIEKLSKEDVAKFLNKKFKQRVELLTDMYDFNNPCFYENVDGKITLKTKYNSFTLTDFEFEYSFGTLLSENAKYDKDWLNFMYAKFGEEYKKAFLNMRENLKNEAIKKYEEKYDKDTEKFENEFKM